MPCNLELENALRKNSPLRIAGVDEAGRGCLAGPVVAAAVVLPEGFDPGFLDDSKKLRATQRDACYSDILAADGIDWSVVAVEADEIDRINILRASQKAMRMAVEMLSKPPGHALVDGLPFNPFPVPQTAVVKGDGKSLSIAAASVVAKVTRDRLMTAHDREFPAYGFATHKGYATQHHRAMLERHGPCRIHRRSFAPVAQTTFGW